MKLDRRNGYRKPTVTLRRHSIDDRCGRIDRGAAVFQERQDIAEEGGIRRADDASQGEIDNVVADQRSKARRLVPPAERDELHEISGGEEYRMQNPESRRREK